jgi:arsenical pump membrane protein
VTAALAEALSAVLLLAVLACAVIRPWGWPEAIVAVPAAGVVIVTRAISLEHARAEAERLGPLIGFLATVLVLAQLCDDEGLFHACGAWMARTAAGRPRRLLVQVFAVAAVITAVLSLDATVVLLTPVVFATAARLGARPRPHVYTCTHLSNTASLLLPVSNLTNLLAFAALGLSFTRFAALMGLPWLVAIGTEYLVFRRFFATDLDAGAQAPPTAEPREVPVFALATVACALAGFVLTSALGVNPAWAAFAGAAVLAVRADVQQHDVGALGRVGADGVDTGGPGALDDPGDDGHSDQPPMKVSEARSATTASIRAAGTAATPSRVNSPSSTSVSWSRTIRRHSRVAREPA